GPVQAPAAQRLEQFIEPGPFCPLDAINDLRRDLVVNGTANQAVGLEFAQLLGEHLLGDGGDEAPQRAGPAWLLQKVEEDDELPLAAHDADRHVDGATIDGLPGHRCLQSLLHRHQKVRTGCPGRLLILCAYDSPAPGTPPPARLGTMNATTARHDTTALEVPVLGPRVPAILPTPPTPPGTPTPGVVP